MVEFRAPLMEYRALLAEDRALFIESSFGGITEGSFSGI